MRLKVKDLSYLCLFRSFKIFAVLQKNRFFTVIRSFCSPEVTPKLLVTTVWIKTPSIPSRLVPQDLCHSHSDQATVQQKVSTIISCFISSFLPPAVQIHLPPEQARRIVEKRRELDPYIFREAQVVISVPQCLCMCVCTCHFLFGLCVDVRV